VRSGSLWPRGSWDGGTDTKAPKSESAEPWVVPRERIVERLDGGSALPVSVGVAGGVAGEKSVANRSMSASLKAGVSGSCVANDGAVFVDRSGFGARTAWAGMAGSRWSCLLGGTWKEGNGRARGRTCFWDTRAGRVLVYTSLSMARMT